MFIGLQMNRPTGMTTPQVSSRPTYSPVKAKIHTISIYIGTGCTSMREAEHCRLASGEMSDSPSYRGFQAQKSSGNEPIKKLNIEVRMMAVIAYE